MAVSQAISAHGTSITFNGTEIPELGDVTLPALMRKPIEDSRHIEEDERFVPGIRKRGVLSFDLGLLASAPLFEAWLNDTLDNYVISLPDGSTWRFVGYVIDLGPSAPVDNKLRSLVVVRPSGVLTINDENSFFLQEDGSLLLLEDGSGSALLLD